MIKEITQEDGNILEYEISINDIWVMTRSTVPPTVVHDFEFTGRWRIINNILNLEVRIPYFSFVVGRTSKTDFFTEDSFHIKEKELGEIQECSCGR